VTVFVVDTGIRWDHDEFYEAPAECGFDSVYASEPAQVDDTETIRESACYDGVGHGTYVAGIIGGDAYVPGTLLCKMGRGVVNVSLN
jgi:subtilisin family serine protease